MLDHFSKFFKVTFFIDKPAVQNSQLYEAKKDLRM